MRSRTVRWFGATAALLLGLSLGVACDKGGGSSSPGSSGGGGGGGCPGAVPRSGSRCQRGEATLCVYRTGGGGDFLCSCGSNAKWGCGKK